MSIGAELRALGDKSVADRALMLNNEAQTKATLVEPFLSTLGYDTSNPYEVRREFKADLQGASNPHKVDFAIFRDDKPIILVETKALEKSLSDMDTLRQLRNYYHDTDARIGILTDGRFYRFYTDIFKNNIMDDEPFLSVDITHLSDGDAASVASFAKSEYSVDAANALSKKLFFQPRIRKFLEAAVQKPEEWLVQGMMTAVYKAMGKDADKPEDCSWFSVHVEEAMQSLLQHRIGPDSSPELVSLATLSPGKDEPPPTQIVFPDGEKRDIKHWVRALVEVSEWLVRNGKLTPADCPLKFKEGQVSCLINTVPTNVRGTPFRKYVTLSNGLFLETSHTAHWCVHHSKWLVERFSLNPSEFHLKFQ